MPRPIKILHTLGALNPGGVEVWLLSLVKSLNTKKFQFDFCTLGSEAGLYAHEMQQHGAVVYRCPQFPISSLGRRFRNVLREGQYDVVHSHVHLFSGALLRWAQAEKVPIRIAHSHASFDDKSDRPLRRYYRGLMQNWIQRFSTHGLAASQIAGKELFTESWQRDERFRVLHYSIDVSCFQSPFNRDELRKELGIPLNAPVLGHVGRCVKAKNHSFLLKIAAEVLKLRPDIHFLFVGDGPLKPEIEEQSSAMRISNNVHFPGTRNDIPRLIRGCMDAFVFPSLWEGLPLAVLEAQAAGLRCVISNNITDEVVIVPEQVVRLPLTFGAAKWAATAIESVNRGKFHAQPAVEFMQQTDFTMEHGLSSLLDIYSAAKTEPNVAES
jgi:glycosyltransferase involved in cell wall biosynthesis